MSDEDSSTLRELLEAMLHGSLGKFVVWLRWLVLCVVAGTVAVVGFVIEVRNGVQEARAEAGRQGQRLEKLESRQQTTNDLVQRHEALLTRQP